MGTGRKSKDSRAGNVFELPGNSWVQYPMACRAGLDWWDFVISHCPFLEIVSFLLSYFIMNFWSDTQKLDLRRILILLQGRNVRRTEGVGLSRIRLPTPQQMCFSIFQSFQYQTFKNTVKLEAAQKKHLNLYFPELTQQLSSETGHCNMEFIYFWGLTKM